jgi:hypothetical protein
MRTGGIIVPGMRWAEAAVWRLHDRNIVRSPRSASGEAQTVTVCGGSLLCLKRINSRNAGPICLPQVSHVSHAGHRMHIFRGFSAEAACLTPRPEGRHTAVYRLNRARGCLEGCLKGRRFIHESDSRLCRQWRPGPPAKKAMAGKAGRPDAGSPYRRPPPGRVSTQYFRWPATGNIPNREVLGSWPHRERRG